MLELGSSGSVRGASSNGRPYREPRPIAVNDRPSLHALGERWLKPGNDSQSYAICMQPVDRQRRDGPAPISAEITRDVSRTSAPSCAIRSAPIRAIGPEAEIAPTTSPVSSKIGAARQRNPMACSSSSTA